MSDSTIKCGKAYCAVVIAMIESVWGRIQIDHRDRKRQETRIESAYAITARRRRVPRRGHECQSR